MPKTRPEVASSIHVASLDGLLLLLKQAPQVVDRTVTQVGRTQLNGLDCRLHQLLAAIEIVVAPLG